LTLAASILLLYPALVFGALPKENFKQVLVLPTESQNRSLASSNFDITLAHTNIFTASTITISSNQYYVSPSGSSSGDGSINNPWDLQTALFGASGTVSAGDIIWLRGGIYQGSFISNLSGQANNRITVRQYPGEQAVIDGNSISNGAILTISDQGQYTNYWGFTVMNSQTKRSTTQSGSSPSDLNRGSIVVDAPGTKLINLIVHDLGTAIGFWEPSQESEIYGSIIYNNGWQGPDRGHGHGIYGQNQTGVKRIVDNIIFNQFSHGIHNFGSSSANLKGFHIEGNTLINNGSVNSAGWAPDILMGGLTAASGITISNNYTYRSDTLDGSLQFGYPNQASQDITIQNNYFSGGGVILSIEEWAQLTFTGNKIYGESVLAEIGTGFNASGYTWHTNDYYLSGSGSTPFIYQQNFVNYNNWKTNSGYDATNSSFTQGTFSGVDVFIRPNQYEANRAHLMVYNWAMSDTVPINLTGVITNGTSYEIRHIYNLYGTPVVTGTQTDGEAINLPMSSQNAPSPIGGGSSVSPAIGPKYGAYLVVEAGVFPLLDKFVYTPIIQKN
ncbi:MAG: hypothetical protein AAF485_10190, partial [Chloroflexota bacterium]